jgi:2-hydroxy-3-oxopropionate reductase
MPSLGFIGLGAMGAPMATNLLRHGHAVTIWARRPEAMAPLLAVGATSGASAADVAVRSDITITMVTDTRAVEEVILGERGIVRGARSGAMVIDHSTIAPDAARRIAAELEAGGIDMLDAPVSGGAAAAEAGALAIMIGGPEAAVERAKPVLSCYAKTTVHIGPNGAGQVAKACNQICTIVNQLGAAEAMLLAERAGVDPRKVKEALMSGFAASRMLDLQAPKMIARDFDGKVESRLHHKDILIVLDLARALGIELPASTVAAGILATLQQRGGARQDSAAIFTVLSDTNTRQRETTVATYLERRRSPSSPTWRTFLATHASPLASVDFFTVPTATFRVLFVLVVLSHERRRIVHVNVTDHPTVAWTRQQIREAVAAGRGLRANKKRAEPFAGVRPVSLSCETLTAATLTSRTARRAP